MEEQPVSLGTKFMDGFVYNKSRSRGGKTYWDCRRFRNGERGARAVSADSAPGQPVIVHRRPKPKDHDHTSNFKEGESEIVRSRLEKMAEEDPEQPPARMLCTKLANGSEGVLCQLPERQALKKALRRVRRRNLSPTPRALQELGELPEEFRRTLGAAAENFLLYDSFEDDEGENSESEDEEARTNEKVIVFTTRNNLQLLAESYI